MDEIERDLAERLLKSAIEALATLATCKSEWDASTLSSLRKLDSEAWWALDVLDEKEE